VVQRSDEGPIIGGVLRLREFERSLDQLEAELLAFRPAVAEQEHLTENALPAN
jgi:hypothetical protein